MRINRRTFLATTAGAVAASAFGRSSLLPSRRDEDGVPIGVQFAGRYGEDALLLQLAGQLERAQPWITRAPERMRRG